MAQIKELGAGLKRNMSPGESGGPAREEAVGTVMHWSLPEKARWRGKLSYTVEGSENPLRD